MATSAELLAKAQSHPMQEFAVVVTLAINQLPPEAHATLEPIQGLDHLFSGTLTGAQIVSLAANPAVLGIEEDTEFHALS